MSGKGRPRKPGLRYPSGQRVSGGPSKTNNKPNREVIERRRRILGVDRASADDLRAAENPLDAMAARGWIEGPLAAAGHAYARLYRRAGLQARRMTIALEQAPETSGVDARRIQDMTAEEIAEVWRVIENRRTAQNDGGDGDAAATASLSALWKTLGPLRSAELYAVCVLHDWPAWALQRIAGRAEAEIARGQLERRSLLTEGLQLARDHLHPRRPLIVRRRGGASLAAAQVEESVFYVDEAGNPDPVRTASGSEVIVVRRRRPGAAHSCGRVARARVQAGG
ncbi:MAG TPA: hypothetical protein VG407_12670 [Caulobacteraceae bacterium]|jgi:hypothetical protein|nr:hypothetical protein [Caulobacteraceae bacterium]